MTRFRNSAITILPSVFEAGLIRYLKRKENSHPLILNFSGSGNGPNSSYFELPEAGEAVRNLVRFLKQFYTATSWRNFSDNTSTLEKRLFVGLDQLSITALKVLLPVLQSEGVTAVMFIGSRGLDIKNSTASGAGILAARDITKIFDVEFGISYRHSSASRSLANAKNEVERIQKTLENVVEHPVPYIIFEGSTWNMPLVLFLRMEKLFKVHTVASKSNTAWESLPGQVFSHCDIARLYKGLEVEISLRPTFVSLPGLATKREMNQKSRGNLSDSNYPLY